MKHLIRNGVLTLAALLLALPAHASELQGLGGAIVLMFLIFIGVPIIFLILLWFFRKDWKIVVFSIINAFVIVFLVVVGSQSSGSFFETSSTLAQVLIVVQVFVFILAIIRRIQANQNGGYENI